MHFFNPVAVLPLVELVRAEATDDVTLATAWDVTKKLGKRGVLVKDAPAFVVNRLLTRQSSVLMQALEHGNTFEETDEAALLLGIPMPPSALLAMVGPRVANHVLHTLHDAFPDRFPLSPTLENFANGEMDVVRRRATTGKTVDEIHEALLDALADEVSPPPRRGRRLVGGRDRRLPDPRRRLPVLPRWADAIPGRERASERVLGDAAHRACARVERTRSARTCAADVSAAGSSTEGRFAIGFREAPLDR